MFATIRPSCLVIALLPAIGVATCLAQSEPELTGGFETSSGTPVAVAEVLAQPELWVMNVQFKPMRLMRLQVTDPQTGRRRLELIWYLVWRAENRTLGVKQEIEQRRAASDRVPVNPDENQLGSAIPDPTFAPGITLVTRDEGQQEIYPDVVLPEIHAEIEKREGIQISGGQRNPLKHMVQTVGPVPPVADEVSTDEKDRVIHGVAVWRNVDPKTDYFSVFMTGFSNGYRLVSGPNKELLVARKTIVQDFWRPGDQFEQEEREFRFEGEPRWIYRIEPGSIDVPNVGEVLGVAGEESRESDEG